MNGSYSHQVRCTFTGPRGNQAKCDFAIPSRTAARILIQSKGYGATGSKMTDILGDVRTIIAAKRPDTAFLTAAWRTALGDNPEEKWERLVHTLGNLTHSAYNTELSNQPYDVKRKSLVDSHFDLNRDFKEIDHWTPESIKARASRLATQALKIWPDVGRSPGVADREKRASAPPTAIRFRESRQPCKNWKDGFHKLVKLFENEKPGLLSRIADDESLFGVVSKDGDRFRRSKIQISEAFVNTHASAAQLQDWCRKLAEFAGIAPSNFEFILPAENT